MKNLKYILIFTLIYFFSCGFSFAKLFGLRETIKGSGKVVTTEYKLDNFNKVEMSNSVNVTIEQSNDFMIEADTDDNIVKHLIVKRKGKKLILEMNDDYRYKNVTVKIRVFMPTFKEIKISGACKCDIGKGFDLKDKLKIDLSGASLLSGGFKADKVDLEASGACNVKFDLEVNELDLDVSGACNLDISGSSNRLEIDGSGASDFKMVDFEVEDCELDLSGACNAYIYSNGTIDINISGASDVRYKGKAQLKNIDSSGASSIKHIE